MATETPAIDTIFCAAVEIGAPEQRAAYIAQACGHDDDLRARVEKLVDAHLRAGSFLEAPAAELRALTQSGSPVLRGEGKGERGVATIDEPAITERPGTVIGPYKLLEQIGEGGFGVVFMAEQTHPVRRKVALKVLKPGMDSRQVVARFEAERQALALMDHPNIAHVFDGGETATGRPYFVMELVRGIPITDFCDHNHLPVRERLGLFISVCQAVQHAHHKGIIHRDLKPTNVLVTLHDGTPVPRVIDFGIAKATGQQLTDKTLFTNFSQMVGTPLYMSPEQAEMSGLDMDTRTDIYSLGVLMYELLTGTTPFDKERLRTAAYDEIRRIIREEEPAKPSTRMSTLGQAAKTASVNRKSDPHRLSQLFRGELDWIVMKALEKDRNRRYESASAFAADVQRYLNDEAVLACPPSAMYRFRKLARRNRRTLAMGSVLVLAALVGIGALAVSTVLVWKADKDVWKANMDLKESVDRERREAYFQRITVAHRELSIDNLAATLQALQDCPEDLRDWEWHYLMRLCKVEPLVIQEKKAVHGVAFSADGGQLASAGGDGDVRIWNSRTGEEVKRLPAAHSDAVVAVAFHPYGRHLATAGADRLVKVWDLTTGQEVFSGPCDAIRTLAGAYTVAYTVAFSPPDGRLVAAGNDGDVNVWDWKKWKKGGRPLHTFSGYTSNSIPVAFSPDGRILAAGGGGQEGQRLWDMETGDLSRPPLPGRSFPVNALAFSPDGGRLASAGLDRMVYVHDTTTGERLSKFNHSGNVLCVAFSRNGRLVASAGEDKTVRVWDATTGREVLGLRGHTAVCTCLAFSPDPDGWRLASASADGAIRIWDATPVRENEGQERLTFEKHNNEIRSVAFSPDGQEIASTGHGGLVKIWNAATGQMRLDFPGHKVLTWSVAWRPPEGRRIASAGSNSGAPSVKVWDAVNGQEVFFELPLASRGGKPYIAVAFSRDGQYLVTGKADGRVEVWDAETGGEVRKLGTHERDIQGLVFSPDGRWLASASSDGVVKIWDAKRLHEKQEPRIPPIRARVPGPSLNVAFSPDGRRLAMGGEENTVKIWDLQNDRELHPLRGHHGEVYTLAFSPDKDGRWVASGGEDSAVKIWDSHSGALVRNFRGHMGIVTSLAFSPDGRLLVSGSRDKTVKVWDMTQLSSEVGDR